MGGSGEEEMGLPVGNGLRDEEWDGEGEDDRYGESSQGDGDGGWGPRGYRGGSSSVKPSSRFSKLGWRSERTALGSSAAGSGLEEYSSWYPMDGHGGETAEGYGGKWKPRPWSSLMGSLLR